MKILAVDPGTVQSGWCLYDRGVIIDKGIQHNTAMLLDVQNSLADKLAIEWIESQGMAVGKEPFITVRWIGRFQQAWKAPEAVMMITRRSVKLHLCGSMRAKDPH